MFGNTNPACREEVKRKIGEKSKGRPFPEEAKRKLAEIQRNRIHPPCPESLKIASSKRMKENNPMWREDVIKNHPMLQGGCFFYSEGEKKVDNILEKMGIRRDHQKRIRRIGKRSYFLDFYLPEFKIAIEFDGYITHSTKPEKDQERDKFLEDFYKIKTIRIIPSELNTRNIQKTRIKIRRFLNAREMGQN